MITGMSFYPQAVVLKGKVYIGGGIADDADQNACTAVTCYDIERNQWTALPQYSEGFFAMTTINEKLVLIGGREPHMAKTSKLIGVWSEPIQRWTIGVKIPRTCVLLTARDAATAISYDNRWLIVIGGRDDAYQSLSKVDIVDVSKNISHSGAPLPQPAHKITAAVIGNTLVLLGGAATCNCSVFLNKVFSVKLDDLISHAVSSSKFASESTSPWQTLPDTPAGLAFPTALAFNGTLLAIGGNKQGDLVDEKYIHLFDPKTKAWVEAGELLINRHGCACTVLPSGEIFITGGCSGRQTERTVHIATLQ